MVHLALIAALAQVAITSSAPTMAAPSSSPAEALLIGDSVMNLKSAVAGETHEYTDMYPGFAKTAREEGFAQVADWFETLAKAEKSHAGKFSKMLDSIK